RRRLRRRHTEGTAAAAARAVRRAARAAGALRRRGRHGGAGARVPVAAVPRRRGRGRGRAGRAHVLLGPPGGPDDPRFRLHHEHRARRAARRRRARRAGRLLPRAGPRAGREPAAAAWHRGHARAHQEPGQTKPQVCVKNVARATAPRTGCDLSEAEVAGMGETWGISGPTFLLFYVVLAVVVLIASIRGRRAVTRVGGPEPVTAIRTRPHDVAYLNGGAELALVS